MLNKEICFRCCLKATVISSGNVEKIFDFRKSFEVGWKNNLVYCLYMAGWIAPLQEAIPSKCPYIVEHVVNAE